MKAAVFDTYVTKKNGQVMHFDIIVKEGTNFNKVQFYGVEYLASKGQAGQALSTNECKFCHIEEATTEIQNQINTKGYYIIEMEGC